MKKILIAGNTQTPELCFYEANCQVWLSGISVPENPLGIFTELNNKTREAFSKCNKQPELHIFMEYFNTASAKFLLDYLQNCIEGHNTNIVWHYETDDEDLLEAGQDYEILTGVKFRFEIMD